MECSIIYSALIIIMGREKRAKKGGGGEVRGYCARHDLPPAANTYITTITRKLDSLMVFSHKLNFLYVFH